MRVCFDENSLPQTDGEQHPLQFSQTFHLMPINNSFVVTNGELQGTS